MLSYFSIYQIRKIKKDEMRKSSKRVGQKIEREMEEKMKSRKKVKMR